MTQAIAARKIKLAELKERFNLRYTEDASFFSEWQESFPALNEAEQQALDRVKRNGGNQKKGGCHFQFRKMQKWQES